MAIRGNPLTLTYVAWNTSSNQGQTGDALNHTLRYVRDGTESTPANSPAEVDATNLPGVYSLSATAAEMTCDLLTLGGTSSRANVSIIPLTITTEHGLLPGIVGGQRPPSLDLGVSNFGLAYSATANANNFYAFATFQNVLYAGGRVTSGSTAPTARILSSTDGGKTWSVVNFGAANGDNEVRSLYASSDGHLYAGTQNGSGPNIYRFDGATWTLDATLSTNYSYVRNFIDFNGNVFAGTDTGGNTIAPAVFSRAGGSWASVATFPVGSKALYGFVFFNNKIWTTTQQKSGVSNGVWNSADGTTWAQTGCPLFPGQTQKIIHQLVVFQGELWCSDQDTANGCSVFRSTDLGVTWEQIAAAKNGFGFGAKEQELYTLYNWNNTTLLGGTFNQTDGGRIWYSQNGENWNQLGEPGAGQGANYQGIFAFLPINANRLITAHRNGNVGNNLPPTRPMFIEQGTVMQAAGLDGIVPEYFLGGTYNLRQLLTLALAMLLGNDTGVGTPTVGFQGPQTSTTRVSAALAANNNRTMTLTPPN